MEPTSGATPPGTPGGDPAGTGAQAHEARQAGGARPGQAGATGERPGAGAAGAAEPARGTEPSEAGPATSGTAAPTRSVREFVSGALKWAGSEGSTAVALVAALTYGVVRIAVEAFYNQFQVSPDEVGLTEPRMIGRAALFLVLFGAFATAAVVSVIAACLAVIELARRGGRDQEDGCGARLHHAHTEDQPAAAVWATVAVVAAFPLIIPFTAPEFAAFLLGHGRGGGVFAPEILRFAAAAWTASLAIGVFLAMRAACPSWNLLPVERRWRLTSGAVFVPLGVVAASAAVGEERLPTWSPTVLAWAVLLFPVAALAILVPVARGRHPTRQLNASAVVSSVVFYVVVAPLALALLPADFLREVLPPGATLFDASDDSLSERLRAVPVVVLLWLALGGLAAWFAWHLGACRAHLDKRTRERPSARPALVAATAVVACAVLLLADERGRLMALRVRDGDRLRPWAGLVLVSAEPVCVTNLPLPHPGPWMFIGEAGGKLVLHDPSDGPHASVAARLDDDFTVRVPGDDADLYFLEDDVFYAGRGSAEDACRAVEAAWRERAAAEEDGRPPDGAPAAPGS